MCRNLDGHGHWVNTLALNSDYVLRTGAFDPKEATLIRSSSELSSKKEILYILKVIFFYF